MKRKNLWIALGVVLVGAAVVAGNLYYRRDKGVVVTTEAIKTRDLEAIVSASGKIQPKRLVNISADTPGRVVNLAVNEGDRVKVGQFLLQIDPKSLRTRVDSGSASLQAAQMSLDQMKQAEQTARVQLQQAQQNLKRQQDLWARQLTTREMLEKAENDVKSADSAIQEREHASNAQAARIDQERAGLESARYDLSKVRIESPIDGIVTSRNIQEGETAVVGTMNNAGTVLLKLADMSVIQAEIEVDETNLPNVRFDQQAKITIDAIPDRTFRGHVSEIGNSPIASTTNRRHDAGDELQGRGRPRRAGARCPPGIHVHRGHHDRDAEGRRRRADSRRGGSRVDLRPVRPGRQAAAHGQEALGRPSRRRRRRAEARADSEGD